MRSKSIRLGLLIGLAGTFGCQTTYQRSEPYYSTMEAFGKDKRELLADRIKDAAEVQLDAKKYLQRALADLSGIRNAQGEAFRQEADDFADNVDDAEDKAEDLREDIREIEDVANSLFADWQGEIGRLSDEELRQRSRQDMEATRQRYQQVIASMRSVSQKLGPAIQPLKEQAQFLKQASPTAAMPTDKIDEAERGIKEVTSLIDQSVRQAGDFVTQETGQPIARAE